MINKTNEELDLIFQQVFKSESGQIVLESLERVILDSSPYCINADFQTDSLLREGGRQLIEFIYSRLNNNINNQ